MAAFSFTATDIDDTPLTFGKFKGMTPNQIAQEDDGTKWLRWAFDTIKDKPICSRELALACEQDDREDDY